MHPCESALSVPPHTSPSIRSWLSQASNRLGDRLEAELLLAHMLKVERSWLYAHGEELLAEDQCSTFESLVARRMAGEPIAYLTGSREFYGRDFIVSPAVLIPRPETELLVELALERLSPNAADILDVGTGSGCIALTLAAERPGWQVTATDISQAALEVCRINAERLSLPKVRLLAGDLLSPVAGQRFAAILSNPPYVAAGDPHLSRGDLRFEPDSALSAGADGLGLIRRLVEQAPDHLQAGGWLFIEHGYDQGATTRQLLRAAGFMAVSTQPDLAGIDRVTLGRLS